MCPLSLLKGDAHLGKRVSLYSRHKLRRAEKLSVTILPSTELDPLLADVGVFPIGVSLVSFYLSTVVQGQTNPMGSVIRTLGVSPFMISM
jgi:hypothetical protein